MKFSHVNKDGKPTMVDISDKPDQRRMAIASGTILLNQVTVKAIEENSILKGNVLLTAQIAGIQSAKKTHEIIPLCHSLQLTKVDVDLRLLEDRLIATSTVKSVGQTGVEMEALQAVSAALLTVYDMCKAIDKEMVIVDIRLLEKTKM
jgi:cyclic pyranopterin monophosphate synthase